MRYEYCNGEFVFVNDLIHLNNCLNPSELFATSNIISIGCTMFIFILISFRC